MQTILLPGSIIAILTVYLFRRFLAVNHDPSEPPILPAKIPVIGHVIGMMKKKADYYVELWQQSQLPIYTLLVPGSKLYVVNGLDLIGAVQRQHKSLAFPPIEAKFAMTVCQSSQEANDILNLNVNGEEGDWGCSVDFYKSIHSALAPGQGLDGMNRLMIRNIATSIDSLKPIQKAGTKIKLAKWLRHHITLATTNSVYGPMNPFQDPKIEEAFWDFQSDLGMILLNVFPSWTASKGSRGRAVVGQAFREYFHKKSHENGSILVQARYANSEKHKIPLEDIARYEVGGAIAILVNTSPALFWMLFYVFSHPQILEDCRREIDAITTVRTGPDQSISRSLDITNLKSQCPKLASTYQESLRHASLGTSVRQVMQDTLLANKYLLKKGSTVLMPSIVVHQDPTIWGPDAPEFNPTRFLKASPPRTGAAAPPPPTRKAASPSPPAAAFRGFGGGTTLCPGRHFATTEILATAAMFCARYDLSPVAGRWIAPTTRSTNVAAAIMEPDTDLEVCVTVREGLGEGDWDFRMRDSEVGVEGI